MNKKQLIFPKDFKKSSHSAIPGANQWKGIKSNGTIVSIIGGGFGIHGDGVISFEMFDFDEDNPRTYMSVNEINEYLKNS